MKQFKKELVAVEITLKLITNFQNLFLISIIFSLVGCENTRDSCRIIDDQLYETMLNTDLSDSVVRISTGLEYRWHTKSKYQYWGSRFNINIRLNKSNEILSVDGVNDNYDAQIKRSLKDMYRSLEMNNYNPASKPYFLFIYHKPTSIKEISNLCHSVSHLKVKELQFKTRLMDSLSVSKINFDPAFLNKSLNGDIVLLQNTTSKN